MLATMSPEEPGAPTPGHPDAGGSATFRPGVETDRPGPTGDAEPRTGASSGTAPSPPSAGAAPAGPGPTTGGSPRPPAAEAPADAPRKVVAPSSRRRLLDDPEPDSDASRAPRREKVRHRKVRRVVRHIEPWSVLKISVLFFLSIFLIICVASAVLWNAARSAGAIDDVESFITSLGFGNCEDIDGADTATTPDTTPSTVDGEDPQVGGGDAGTPTTLAEAPEDDRSTIPDEDGECAEGQRLVGGFKFEDTRIFQSFLLFGVVLVLTGAAASVVMALLFNLISDLTGGVRVTVLEEEPVRPRTGSPVRTKDD